MADDKTKSAASDIGHHEIDAATQVLKTLCAEGKYAILLSRMGIVRLAGDIVDFQRLLLDKLGEEVDNQRAKAILAEIKRFCRYASSIDSVEQAMTLFENHSFSQEFKKLTEEADKEALRSTLRSKLKAAHELLPPAFRDRKTRLASATDASLEDVDIEVVKERRDDYQGSLVDQPFLRLRIRHTDGSGLDLPWSSVSPIFQTVFQDLNWPCKSFLLECDETDIDFLMFRLREAKTLLSSAVCESVSSR